MVPEISPTEGGEVAAGLAALLKTRYESGRPKSLPFKAEMISAVAQSMADDGLSAEVLRANLSEPAYVQRVSEYFAKGFKNEILPPLPRAIVQVWCRDMSRTKAVPEEVSLAARLGKEATVLAWLGGGGRVDARFEYHFMDGPESGMTLLMVATLNCHERLAETLIQRGADISLCDDRGQSVLMNLAANGTEDMVVFALRHGAKIDHRSHNGSTALMQAAYFGHEKAVQALIRGTARSLTCRTTTGPPRCIRPPTTATLPSCVSC